MPDVLSVILHLIILREGLSFEAARQLASPTSCCLCPLQCWGYRHACGHTWLYMASSVLNSDPCVCTTSTLTRWVISRARVYPFFSWWPAGWFLPSCCHSSTRFCVIQRGEIPACFNFYCCLQMFGTFCNNVWIVASMCCSYKIKTLEFCWWLHRSCRLLWDYCCLHNVESNLWREDAFPVV